MSSEAILAVVDYITRDIEDLLNGTVDESRDSWTCIVKSVTVDSCADIQKLLSSAFAQFAVRFASCLARFLVVFIPLG